MMKTEILGYDGMQNTMASGNIHFHSPPHNNHGMISPRAQRTLSPNPGSPALSTESSTSGPTNKAEPPKRLRYWLVDMIDSGEIPGLRWEDAARTIFRIPWKHAGKNNWKEEDSKIFKAWAEHRGKYREGDKIEAATWKTRLRCALNKLSDIKEVKERSNLEGSDPYRVYQLLPELDKAQENEIYPRNAWRKGSPSNPIHHSPISSEPNDYMEFHRHENNMAAENNPRLSPYAAHGGVQSSCMAESMRRPVDPAYQLGFLSMEDRNVPPRGYDPSGYPTIHENHLDIQPPAPAFFGGRSPPNDGYKQDVYNNQPVENPQPHLGLVSPSGSDHLHGPMETFDVTDYQQQFEVKGVAAPNVLQPPDRAPRSHEMEIYVKYRGCNAVATHVTEPTGCRIHHGDSNLQLIAVAQHELPSDVFGPESLQQIGLVDCTPFSASEKQTDLTRHVLKNITRGLILFYNSDDGCFYIQRLCQSRVFFYGPESTGTTPEKLDRNKRVKVFDYQKFCSQLQKYSETGENLPETELNVSFSQNWSIQTPIEKNLVTLVMVPRAAAYLLSKVGRYDPSDNFNSIIATSLDSFDALAEHATNQSGRCVDDLITHILGVVDMDSDTPQPFRNLPDTRPPTTQSQVNFTSGFFQENVLRTPPIAMQEMNDIDMPGYATRP